jgi:hypothetical protein
MPLIHIAIDHEPAPPMLHRVSEPDRPRRLQPRQHANRLQQRCLPLRIRPHEHIHPRRKLASQRFKTPEMAKRESSEHAPPLYRRNREIQQDQISSKSAAICTATFWFLVFLRRFFSSAFPSAPLSAEGRISPLADRLCVKIPFGCGFAALGKSAVKKETPIDRITR